MKCSKPNDIQGMEKALEDTSKMIYWDEIAYEIDKVCQEIAHCPNKCGNEFCKGLQDSNAIQLAFEEEMADNSIIDTLPDDEFF